MSLDEKFRIRSRISDTKQIRVPIGTDLTSYGAGDGAAGTVVLVEDVLAILVNDVAIDESKVTTEIVNAAKQIDRYSAVATSAETWKAGELIYYDGTTKKFTNVAGNLKPCGQVLEPKASGAGYGLIEFDGTGAGEGIPDITP